MEVRGSWYGGEREWFHGGEERRKTLNLMREILDGQKLIHPCFFFGN